MAEKRSAIRRISMQPAYPLHPQTVPIEFVTPAEAGVQENCFPHPMPPRLLKQPLPHAAREGDTGFH